MLKNLGSIWRERAALEAKNAKKVSANFLDRTREVPEQTRKLSQPQDSER